MTLLMLGLGVIAWAITLAALVLRKRLSERAAALCSVGSFAACAASLGLVVVYQAHQVDIWDASALMDTANAFRLCSVTLLLGTLAFNALALLIRPRTKAR